MKYKTVIFDFDGTIADTTENIVKSMIYTLEQFGLTDINDEEIKKYIGLSLELTLLELGITQNDITKAIFIYREKFSEGNMNKAVLYPGVSHVIDELSKQNYILTIATSREGDSLEELLLKFNINEYFKYAVSVNMVENKKPAPDMVNIILKQLNLEKDEAIVVGDSIYDIGMAKNAGCTSCAVTYGNGIKDELEKLKPDYIIDKIDDLLNIV